MAENGASVSAAGPNSDTFFEWVQDDATVQVFSGFKAYITMCIK